MIKADLDNRQHLHRHALRALEDFEALRAHLWEHELGQSRPVEKWLHAISHHLRHSVYRSGIEVNWNHRVRRSHR